jgi:hypothetical protein
MTLRLRLYHSMVCRQGSTCTGIRHGAKGSTLTLTLTSSRHGRSNTPYGMPLQPAGTYACIRHCKIFAVQMQPLYAAADACMEGQETSQKLTPAAVAKESGYTGAYALKCIDRRHQHSECPRRPSCGHRRPATCRTAVRQAVTSYSQVLAWNILSESMISSDGLSMTS